MCSHHSEVLMQRQELYVALGEINISIWLAVVKHAPNSILRTKIKSNYIYNGKLKDVNSDLGKYQPTVCECNEIPTFGASIYEMLIQRQRILRILSALNMALWYSISSDQPQATRIHILKNIDKYTWIWERSNDELYMRI